MYSEEIKDVFLQFAKQDIGFSDDAIDGFVKLFEVTKELETSISKDLSKFTESEVKILIEMVKAYPIELIKRFFILLEIYHIWYWRDFVCSEIKNVNPFSDEVVSPLIKSSYCN